MSQAPPHRDTENYETQVKNTHKAMGERVKLLRKQSGLSQQQLAEKIDISQNFLSQVETGRFRLSDIKIAQLAELFDVSVAYLFGFGSNSIDAGDFISVRQNEGYFKDKALKQFEVESGESRDIDETTRAIVILRNIIRDKDNLPPGDKEILRQIMELGIKALEDNPAAVQITSD